MLRKAHTATKTEHRWKKKKKKYIYIYIYTHTYIYRSVDPFSLERQALLGATKPTLPQASGVRFKKQLLVLRPI